MRLARNVMSMGEVRNAHNILVGNLKGRDSLIALSIDRRMWSGFIWL